MIKLDDKLDNDQRFTRRALLLASGQAALGTVILTRLAYLGIVKSPQFQSLSEENRIKLHHVLPKRGLIYDRHKRLLADNIQSFHLVIVPEEAVHLSQTLKKAAEILNLSQDEQLEILQIIKTKPRFIPTTLAVNLSWEDVCRLELNMMHLPGCSIENGWMRHYPNGQAASHIVGYVQTPSQEDSEENPLFRINGFKIGKTGLEKTFDNSLRGIGGYKQVEVNARNRLVRELHTEDSKKGDDIQLSLNLTLQQYLYERLMPYESAGAVVLDILTGQILALHSHPSFDPNLFINGIKKNNWKELVHNPYRPLHNKVIQGTYPPGSIFKVIVALAALKAGIIDPSYHSHCSGYIEMSGHRFHCWHKQGHGSIDLVRALAQSCDTYFYEIAKKLGHAKIASMANLFGFGEVCGIEIPGEKAGLVPTKEWKLKHRKKAWTIGDTILIGIGQGTLLATPLQLAVAMATFVHPQQQKVNPTLLIKNQIHNTKSLDINTEFIELVKQGLDETVNSPFGLGYHSRIIIPGREMGGKTSTVQVRRISSEERARGVLKNEQRPWEQRDHAMFAGYAPIHQPRFVVAAVVEHGGAGGRVAAPLGRDILIKTQELSDAT